MFYIHGEKSGSQAEGRVVRNEAREAARSLVSHDENFQFYSKYVIAMNEPKSKS